MKEDFASFARTHKPFVLSEVEGRACARRKERASTSLSTNGSMVCCPTGIVPAEEQGFTLIEALVALLILAIASAGIIGAIETQVDTTRGLEQRAAALWVAENRLAELRLAGGTPVAGVGTVEMLGAPWQVSVTPRSSDDPDLRLVEVEVRQPSKTVPLVALRGFVDAGTTTRR